METELHHFLATLFGWEDRGWFVYVPYITKSHQFKQEWFRWPEQIATITNYILTNSLESDVYIAPALFREKKATKEGVAASHTVWVDFDEERAIDLSGLPEPTIRIQTSNEYHEHVYWATSELSPAVTEDINRRLTNQLGADWSGHDCTQILRPPGTFNYKSGNPMPVKAKGVIKAAVGVRYGPEKFDSVPPVKSEIVLGELKAIPDWKEVLGSYNKYLPKKTVKKLLSGPESTVEDRSKWLFVLGCELAEAGLKIEEIMSLVSEADEYIGKFKNRTDREKRLQALAAKCIHTITTNSAIPVYNFSELLALDINLESLWGNFLPATGNLMLSGAPGMGKSRLSIQAAFTLALRRNLLGIETSFQSDDPICFFSLEMPPAGLKAVCEYMRFGFTPEEKEVIDNAVRFVGEGIPYPQDQLERAIDELHPSLVMFDSMSSLAEARMSDEEEAQRLTRWDALLRSNHNCASWYIHHNRKATSENKKPNKLSDVYGSYIFGAKFDSIFTLWRDKLSVNSPVTLNAVKTRYSQEFELELYTNSQSLYLETTKVASLDSAESGSTGNFDSNDPEI